MIRIATRGSALALWQANHVRDCIARVRPDAEVSLVVIKTTGDKILDRPLAKIGGKALFVKEIEQALLDNAADIAVHSMKDVPPELADGLVLSAVSAREDPTDSLCARDANSLKDLQQGATVGTSSMRRACQLLAYRSDFVIAPLRGNVPTRLDKLRRGDFDAIVLATAGLIRLGHTDQITERLSTELCLPAVGQGVLGLETRADDEAAIALIRQAVHDETTSRRVDAERSFLRRLEGSCQTPIAAFATEDGDFLEIRGRVGTPDGTRILESHRRGPRSTASSLGQEVADELLARGAADIIRACEL